MPRPSKTFRRERWWTRDRVLAGLRRFHREHGLAPTSTEEWQRLTGTPGGDNSHPERRPYPSFYGVLSHFATFRQAWEAAGVDVDRSYEGWSALEDWYLYEGTGVLTREELAADLNRTPDAVHRRLYDLGLNAWQRWGWTPHRIERAAGITSSILRRYMDWGEIPWFKGTKVIYIDPGDLVVVEEIDWETVSDDLLAAVTRSLRERVVKILSGQDWRAGRPYRTHQVRGLSRIKQPRGRRFGANPPKTRDVGPGDQCVVRGADGEYAHLNGKTVRVHVVFYARMKMRNQPKSWRARCEFIEDGAAARVNATLQLDWLYPLESRRRIWCGCGALIVWGQSEAQPESCAFCASPLVAAA